ncbi:DUF4392 domain-containing protein [Conexibacter sp. JD483]|uniref:glutamate cyclase domain-containing protein n=1 Tax=unclassified Conexibacter TaxID=2627773 RepID=UPI002724DB89|nr:MULTISPECIES: glutamate cyclase domain-containing protein [unclassified Conexibacter]MDO8187338.1 DUF4392 domain-containing protein [Conexibacter sp. CPCC 205706]MDO8200529.1 DUF4392 domain-containing protein [Conexibacter sp. CPCC 205762]MDR9370002.1 DUF4392 domain-containing protein [Conexibacter sp. JD483]
MNAIDHLERVAARDAGRGIGPLAQAAAGGLRAAATGIAAVSAPSLAFVTGCFVVRSEPPAPETDGPVGAALAAAAFARIGIEARLVTDARCAAVVRACAPDLPLHVGDEPDPLEEELAAAGVTHVVFVERLGPAADGVVRNMRGDDVSAVTPPLHRLADGPWATIAIGDGGNEVGMGALPPPLVAATVAHGERIHCAVACDALIVAGVSNWGAIALAHAVALLIAGADAADRGAAVADRGASVATRGADAARACLSPAAHDAVLAAAVAAGAVDGVLGRPVASVDGVDPAVQHEILLALAAAR